MADPSTIHAQADPDRLVVIRECMEHYDVGDPAAEWPNNLISRKAVVYGSGQIARRGEPIQLAADPAELALCRRLAASAAEVMAGVAVGMGSESGDEFRGFFVAGAPGEPPPPGIDDVLIRSRFGGTIFPPATITVEALSESGIWWSEVQADGSGSGADYFVPWRALIRWFGEQPEFTATAFVRIGDRDALGQVGRAAWPAGTENPGCVLPRLALGLTRGGSLVGLFGHTVQT